MTREHDDKRVSDAYRDVATERTPKALDDKVLAMAAAEARTRYGLARAWIRPVAWAATIGLSLAFVLEMSQYANVADEVPRTELPAAEADDALSEPAPPARTPAQPVAAPAGSDAEAKSVDSGRRDTNLRETREAAPAALDSAAVARELDSDDMPMVREAEEQARMRSGEARDTAVLADRAVAGFAAEKSEAAACDADDRATPALWFACVEGLREDGLDDEASRELVALREAFPDFRPPRPE